MKKKIMNFVVGFAIVLALGVAAVYVIGYTVGVPTVDKATILYGMVLGATVTKTIGMLKTLLQEVTS